jgi:hypothetical protein
MPADKHVVPDWVDRRTAEWCAAICDAVAARIKTPHAARIGADACASQIRGVMQAARPQLPALVDSPSYSTGGAGGVGTGTS